VLGDAVLCRAMCSANAMASRCCVMLCVAMCSARLWQGLRSAVLFYVLRCDAMRCYAKARARRCHCFSIPDDG
jgi:type IV secretory pathway TrbF-like protein